MDEFDRSTEGQRSLVHYARRILKRMPGAAAEISFAARKGTGSGRRRLCGRKEARARRRMKGRLHVRGGHCPWWTFPEHGGDGRAGPGGFRWGNLRRREVCVLVKRNM